jgi:hypothetical protein
MTGRDAPALHLGGHGWLPSRTRLPEEHGRAPAPVLSGQAYGDGSSRKVYEMHMKGLELLGQLLGPGCFVDAIWDWALVRLGQRKVWRGYPF